MLKPVDEVPKAKPEGIGDLAQRLVEDGKAYAMAEVAYVKTLGKAKVAALKVPLILGVIALMFAHAAFLLLIATLFVGLASLMSDTLAGLVTTLICLGIAGVAGNLAFSKVSAVTGSGAGK